jgi:hypothetical protein
VIAQLRPDLAERPSFVLHYEIVLNEGGYPTRKIEGEKIKQDANISMN